MANPICLSPLKFYDSFAKQSHRKSYAYGHISPLITKTGWVPPFQFVIPDYIKNNSYGTWETLSPELKSPNGYCGVNGVYYETNSYRTSIPIEVKIGDKIKVIAAGTVSMITKVNSSGDYLSTIQTGTSTAETHLYTSTFNGYIAISYRNAEGLDLKILYSAINAISIIDVKTNSIVHYISQDKFDIQKIDDYNVLFYRGTDKIENVQEGLYFLKIDFNNNGGIWSFYSEVFCFDNITKDCLELEYWNETGNFAVKNGVIAFPSDFHFKLLLKGEIGKPEYNFEEESTKRLGYVYIESQVSKKTYKFNVVVPEYICDALRLVRLCDNKIIRCKDDEYEAITFEMEADWQTQGDLASVTCEFETDNVIANIGGFVPDKLGGDYNNDYDDDFDKE